MSFDLRRPVFGGATLALVVATACSGHVATNLASKPLEFYNEGCDGYLFQSKVRGETAILSRMKPDGTEAGALVFNATGGGEYEYDAAGSSNLVTDNEPVALATLTGDKICYRFTSEDVTDDACFVSLIKTGAFCTDLEPAPDE